jgi:hypothetical protein
LVTPLLSPLVVTANQCCFIGYGARCFAESGFRLSIRAIRDDLALVRLNTRLLLGKYA